MSKIKLLAFDADDTLWHHENYVQQAWDALHNLMQAYGHFPEAAQAAQAKQIENLKLWGFGVKSIILAMIEAAVAMTQGRITGTDIQKIIEIGRQLYLHPIVLLDGVATTLEILAQTYPLMLITKGDLWAQENKLVQSGLAHYFKYVEIVSDKDVATYDRVFHDHNIDPQGVVMIGNSVKSDILPLIALGAQAIHVPYYLTWQFERAEIGERDQNRFIVLPSMHELPDVLQRYEPSDAACLVDLVPLHATDVA